MIQNKHGWSNKLKTYNLFESLDWYFNSCFMKITL